MRTLLALVCLLSAACTSSSSERSLVLGEELLLVLLSTTFSWCSSTRSCSASARALEPSSFIERSFCLSRIELLAEPQHDALQHLREAVQHARCSVLVATSPRTKSSFLSTRRFSIPLSPHRRAPRARLDRLETRRHPFELGLDRCVRGQTGRAFEDGRAEPRAPTGRSSPPAAGAPIALPAREVDEHLEVLDLARAIDRGSHEVHLRLGHVLGERLAHALDLRLGGVDHVVERAEQLVDEFAVSSSRRFFILSSSRSSASLRRAAPRSTPRLASPAGASSAR